MSTISLFLCLTLFISSNSQSVLPRLIGTIKLPGAAYLEAYQDQGNESTPVGDRWSLYVSSFIYNPFQPDEPDSRYVLRGLGSQLYNVNDNGNLDWNLLDLGKTSLWPNNPDIVPFEAFNTHAIIWTSGFLPEGKRAGSLELYDTSADPPKRIINIAASDTSEWAYHRAIWKDMNGDGYLDVLTARFYKPKGAPLRQLVWFENPNLPLASQPASGWTQHILLESGADVHFETFSWTSKSNNSEQIYECIIAPEFFLERLAIYYTVKGGNWSNWDEEVGTIVLEPANTNGLAFDVNIDDFNRDGKIDFLLTTIDLKDPTGGKVVLYEIPENFPEGQFTKRIIMDGFIPNVIIGGVAMSPGSPKAFYPNRTFEEEVLAGGKQHKPYILLSGDDNGNHYILEPSSESETDWTYKKHLLVETGGITTGKFAVGDFDGDGYSDIVAAGYSSGTLFAFTYAP